MSRFFKPAILGTSVILLTAGIALANPKADTNNDGMITKAEFMSAASDRFIDTDLNADGALSKDEMKASRELRKEAHAQKRFNDIDANGDGVISQSEYDAKRAERSEKILAKRKARRDLNNDGVVDDADKELRKAKRTERKEKRAERKENRSVNRDNYRKRIKRDANGDGLITRAEYDTATEAMFIRLDANADGVLTKGEGKKRGKKRRQRPGRL